MKKLIHLSVALLLSVALIAPAVAGDAKTVTLQGEMNCARCTLKEDGMKDCQNVLVVTKDGEESHYWLAKNEANQKFGDTCMNKKIVQVTGVVEEKDGRTWIAATEIKPLEAAS